MHHLNFPIAKFGGHLDSFFHHYIITVQSECQIIFILLEDLIRRDSFVY